MEHTDKNTKEEIIAKAVKDNSPKKHDITKDDYTKVYHIKMEVQNFELKDKNSNWKERKIQRSKIA